MAGWLAAICFSKISIDFDGSSLIWLHELGGQNGFYPVPETRIKENSAPRKYFSRNDMLFFAFEAPISSCKRNTMDLELSLEALSVPTTEKIMVCAKPICSHNRKNHGF